MKTPLTLSKTCVGVPAIFSEGNQAVCLFGVRGHSAEEVFTLQNYKEHAEHIIKCVNSHEDLLNSIRELLELIDLSDDMSFVKVVTEAKDRAYKLLLLS